MTADRVVAIVAAMRDQFTDDGVVLDNALQYWIHRVYQASRNETFRTFCDEGEEITPEQWIVLARLWEEDGQTQTELGASTYRDRPTMSRILDGMERRGLLQRRADPASARVWRVHLTAQGTSPRATCAPQAAASIRR